MWTSGGRQADYALLIARTDWDLPKHKGISFFFLPMKQEGVEVRALRQATGDARFNEVFLTGARVPHANMLGAENDGWRVLQTALAYERVAMGRPRAGGGTQRRANRRPYGAPMTSDRPRSRTCRSSSWPATPVEPMIPSWSSA